MGKLFDIAGEGRVSTESVDVVSDELPTEALSEMLVEGAADMALGIEATQMAVEQFNMVTGMLGHMQAQKLCSGSYMASMESYSPVVEALGMCMGVKSLPALEDFVNPHAAQTCHAIAMEGFKDMIAKAWEKIKAFFRDFFKKIDQFIKRIVKANLDLASYEKYCDQLVTKLNANNATISNNRARVNSELPKLLADKGDREVNSDFIINRGSAKIKNILSVTEGLIRTTEETSIPVRLSEFHKSFKGFIQETLKSNDRDINRVTEEIEKLKEKGLSVISGLFPYRANGKDLTPNAYEALAGHYGSGRINNDQVTLMALADPGDAYKELPQGTNFILAHVDNSDFFTVVAKDEVLHLPTSTEPISSLEGLTRFHKEYKSSLGKLNLTPLSKTADQVSDEVDKILELLHRDFVNVINTSIAMASSNPVDKLTAMLIKLKEAGKFTDVVSAGEFDQHIITGLNDVEGSLYQRRGSDSTESVRVFGSVILFNLKSSIFENDEEALKKAKNKLVDFIKASKVNEEIAHLYATGLVENFPDVFKSGLATDVELERQKQIKEKLLDFNKYMVNLFTRLQSVFRSLMTDFYGLLTTLRYQTIKYIYDSAKLYTY